MSFLKDLTQEQQTDVLAQYLPSGRIYSKKFDDQSNLRKILFGLAAVWLEDRKLLNELFDEYDPETTTKFIEEWEKTVGIPDDCFNNLGTDEERRKNILLKLTGINTTTKEQFEALAVILGIGVNVISGFEESVLPQIIPFIILDGIAVSYTIVVEVTVEPTPSIIPQIIPFIIQESGSTLLECLFNKLKPANTQIIFKFLG